jgi:hypothetical protein
MSGQQERRDAIERALVLHKAAGRIRDWRRGPEGWSWLIDMVDGKTVKVTSSVAADLVCAALASAANARAREVAELERQWVVLAWSKGSQQRQTATMFVTADNEWEAVARAVLPSAPMVRLLIERLGLDEHDDYDRVRLALVDALQERA